MSTIEPIYPTFDSILSEIKNNGDTLVHRQIAGIKAWLLHKHRPYHNRLENELCYIKFETNRGYLTIGREVPELQGKIGKTVNRNLFLRLNEYDTNPLLIFADPYEIRVLDHETFYIKSYEFTQKTNNEIVMAIDKNLLIPYHQYMDPNYRKKREPEDKNQTSLGDF